MVLDRIRVRNSCRFHWSSFAPCSLDALALGRRNNARAVLSTIRPFAVVTPAVSKYQLTVAMLYVVLEIAFVSATIRVRHEAFSCHDSVLPLTVVYAATLINIFAVPMHLILVEFT